jgi:GH15 family glucan-1,4-alpha-glucosidase
MTLLALGEFGQRHPDDPELPQLFQGLAAPLADHMVAYRDHKTKLPKPSYDLWEERRGTHAFTVAAVIAGLRSAAALARMGSLSASNSWEEVASEVEEALCKHLFDDDRGCWLRGFDSDGARDETIDASTLMIGLLGVGSKEMVSTNYRVVCDALTVRSPIGGFARYSGDYYFRASDAYPGNPWIITTLWVARTARMLGNEAEARHWLEWTIAHATPTGMLPEQLHPDTGKPLSVSPLTWSHAEFVETCLDLTADG